ncbi:MAG: Maf-like protein [Oculatellaceae cyanobacterium Prado106]|nr:Maf-like protein [Oculatellaceae cyanobacterium Prado106]
MVIPVQMSDPVALVQTLAQGKAADVAPQFSNSLILGCDSILAFQGEICGKPADAVEAIARWQSMRGQVGDLYTGHVLIDQTQGRTVAACQMTRVFFGELSNRQIAAYVRSTEPLGCAGSFALEGLGGLLIDRIEGCYSNVIGLSLPLLRKMLGDLGHDVVDFWKFMQE